MEESAALSAAGRDLVIHRVAYQKEVDAQIEQLTEAYRARMSEVLSISPRGRRPICVLAEGDSWFLYTVGLAIIFFVDRDRKIEVMNLAAPGDEVRDMMTPYQFNRLKRALRLGPAPGDDFDFFLFSGGGNDLLGQGRFRCWLHQYEEGMTAQEVLNRDSLGTIMSYLRDRYQEIVDARDEISPSTRMLVHGYDFAYPSYDGVCGSGPWMKPGLVERDVPEELQRDVVREFLLVFRQMLESIVESNDNLQLVETQGVLTLEADWDNEIHPTKDGFKQLADKFIQIIKGEN